MDNNTNHFHHHGHGEGSPELDDANKELTRLEEVHEEDSEDEEEKHQYKVIVVGGM